MNRLKISFIITVIVVIAIGLIFTFSLGTNFPTNSALAVFISAKVLVTLLLIAGASFAILSGAKTGSSASVVGVGILYQFIPLIVRYLVKSNVSHSVAFAWTIVLVALALYIVLGFGLSFQDKLMTQRDEATASNEIPVQAEKRLATDDTKE